MLKSFWNKMVQKSGANVKIPIRSVTRTPYFVYFKSPDLPAETEIRETVLAWWREHAQPQVKHIGEQMYDANFLQVTPLDLENFPPCSALKDITSISNPELESQLADTKSCLSLWASDSLGDPRVGLLLGRMGAQSLAHKYGGVAVDAVTGFVMDPEIDMGALPAIVEEITVLPSAGSTSQCLSPRTAGAAKYGIPELQICDVPQGLEYHVSKLFLGAIEVLGSLAAKEADRAGDSARNITVPSIITVRGEDVARAMGPQNHFSYTMAQKVQVNLAFHRGKSKRPDIGIPDYVPFVVDLNVPDYDGIIELRPPDEWQTGDSAEHWVKTLSLQLGLGDSATGD